MIEIRNRWSDAVIYTHDVEGETMRQAVLAVREQLVAVNAMVARLAEAMKDAYPYISHTETRMVVGSLIVSAIAAGAA